jgi:hypothetical protein
LPQNWSKFLWKTCNGGKSPSLDGKVKGQSLDPSSRGGGGEGDECPSPPINRKLGGRDNCPNFRQRSGRSRLYGGGGGRYDELAVWGGDDAAAYLFTHISIHLEAGRLALNRGKVTIFTFNRGVNNKILSGGKIQEY